LLRKQYIPGCVAAVPGTADFTHDSAVTLVPASWVPFSSVLSLVVGDLNVCA